MAASGETRGVPARVRGARIALAIAASLFALAVLAQVLTAGLAVFANPGWWPRHTAFVHAFEWLSPLAVLLAYVARSPRGDKVLAWLTVVLLFLQYFTAGLRLTPGRQPLAAVHAVTAVLLFWSAAELARRSMRGTR